MRLIDADALIKEAYTEGAYGYVDAFQIASAPSIDAVPVVRCKDCIYSYEKFGFIYCTFGPYGDCAVPSQFYCAEGKRKENKYGICNTL